MALLVQQPKKYIEKMMEDYRNMLDEFPKTASSPLNQVITQNWTEPVNVDHDWLPSMANCTGKIQYLHRHHVHV